MNRQKIFRAGIAALAVSALAAFLAFDRISDSRLQKESYRTFKALASDGQLKSVKISEDKLLCEKTDGSRFSAPNPDSPLLKEFLLEKDVDIIEEKSASDIVSIVLDIFFYAVFFGALFFGWKKVISPNTFKAVKKTGKTFDDIVGMDSLKKDMVQIVEILKAPAKWAKKGIRMPKGILLEGAPGNGKTLFARALAGEAKVNFIAAKATDFESMFMSIGPMKVKMLFRKARKIAPCIVFIDEFDGIGTRRNYSGSAIETENTRIVTALLNELDGFVENSGILVIAATNNSKALDEALIRPGRFDAHCMVPYPDKEARIKLVELYSKGKNIDPECSPSFLAEKFNGFSCAKIESTLNRAALMAQQNGSPTTGISEINSAIS